MSNDLEAERSNACLKMWEKKTEGQEHKTQVVTTEASGEVI